MANINKIRLSGTTYNIEDAALKGDIYINSSNRNSIQSVIKEGVYSLSSDDVYSISGTKTNSTDRIKGLIIVDNTTYNFTGSTSSDVEGVSALAGIVTFDLSTNFSISLVNRDTNHINELFIEGFTSSGDESPLLNITITHNPSIGVNKIDYVATLYTEFVREKYALAEDLNAKQDTLSAGTGIDITDNVISATGGGGFPTEKEETISEAINYLDEKKLDATAYTPFEASRYDTKKVVDFKIEQAASKKVDKVDAVTNEQLKEELAKYETLVDEANVEETVAYALNNINQRLIAIENYIANNNS